ncbi:uncharacterized protein LOC124809333 [Hydra vulgaris]|uniref:uncharacterized protein LOC124809333 n=1 Tax=Hydra vulgaris TaxID=6087 RepID=UPI001F5EB18D|nr:uncharacterized protein LOC124809333 [Hydra vulgaris]
MASIFYSYTPKDVRSLAYECALQYKIKIPGSWTVNKMARKEWMTSFLKRNPQLSIRKPEATSLGRATSLNAANVKVFFDKLGEVMDIYKFSASQIWNVDETSVSTVVKPSKIVAAKGKRNVGAMTSGERGTNVTMVTAVSGSGNTVPPMYVFSCKNYKDYFINNGPPDCIGVGNGSGWVTDIEFKNFMQHLIRHVKPSNEYKILLILDNHSSHLHFETLNLAKENGICFQKTIVYPYNATIFADDFLPSFVTDHIEPANLVSELSHVAHSEVCLTSSSGQSVKTSINKETMLLISETPKAFSPETVRPYQKAAPRKIHLTR